MVGGSKLRIIRVPGDGYFKGILTANSSVPDTPEEAPSPVKVLELASGSHKVEIGFYIKTYDELVDGSANFDAVFTKQGNTVFCNILGHGKTTVMESLPVITYKNADSNNNTTVDYLAFYQFLTGSAYLEATIISSTLTNKSLAGVANWLYEEVDGSSSSFTFKVGTSEPLKMVLLVYLLQVILVHLLQQNSGLSLLSILETILILTISVALTLTSISLLTLTS